MKTPIIVAYGGGINSTALLCGMIERGAKPDAILFADTGGEKPETYDYVFRFGAFLGVKGFPTPQIVQNDGIHKTLERNCLTNKTLPSIAFGFKSCSDKYKIRPQHKWCRRYQPALDCWEAGGKVIRLIGIAAHETRRASIKEDKFYQYLYPLIEWGWGQEECVAAINRVAPAIGIPIKSACFFCPSSSKPEILWLKQHHPELYDRCVAMEHNAEENNVLVKGLGRRFAWSDIDKMDKRNITKFPLPVEATPACVCIQEIDYLSGDEE